MKRTGILEVVTSDCKSLHNSTPDPSGSSTSKRIRSGLCFRTFRNAEEMLLALAVRKPARSRNPVAVRVILRSSSTTRTSGACFRSFISTREIALRLSSTALRHSSVSPFRPSVLFPDRYHATPFSRRNGFAPMQRTRTETKCNRPQLPESSIGRLSSIA